MRAFKHRCLRYILFGIVAWLAAAVVLGVPVGLRH